MRFTVRRMMVAVAVTGALSGAERLRQKSVTFTSIARFHATKERRHLASIAGEKAAYFSRCQGLIKRGVPISQSEIDAGLAEAWALWPDLSRKGINPNDNDCKAGVPNGYQARLAWNLGTGSELATYHGRLRRKFERAAWYPWLPVEPDLPQPK